MSNIKLLDLVRVASGLLLWEPGSYNSLAGPGEYVLSFSVRYHPKTRAPIIKVSYYNDYWRNSPSYHGYILLDTSTTPEDVEGVDPDAAGIRWADEDPQLDYQSTQWGPFERPKRIALEAYRVLDGFVHGLGLVES